MSATVNTFPPFQSMSSPRGWALTLIVLLHAGLFSALMSGMGTRMVTVLRQTPTQVIDVAPVRPEERIVKPRDITVDTSLVEQLVVPEPDHIFDIAEEPPTSTGQTISEMPGDLTGLTSGNAVPAIELPSIDPRLPLREPEYPPTEIRLNHGGTVLLGVYVLDSGRIGDVRIEQSSGFERLDSAARRAALVWRLKPGTQGGRPVAMWKTVPVTFQLKK